VLIVAEAWPWILVKSICWPSVAQGNQRPIRRRFGQGTSSSTSFWRSKTP